jgi:hypothetical protein
MGRVVCETEKRSGSPGGLAKRPRMSVVLPPPEGDETMKR